MALFDDNIRKQLAQILDGLKDDVNVVFFTQEIECESCHDAHQFIDEICAINPKLKMTRYNLVTDAEKAAEYKVEMVPAVVMLDKDGNDTNIRFFGIPGGYEINSFLGALLEVSGERQELPEDILKRIQKIDKDIHIQVFVTLSCPHCPGAVITAHRLALENKKVKADMIEANTFVPLSIKYNVSGVPKIVINGEHELLGDQPITAFLDVIEKI
ncbi:MAG: thioredoxin family protein [Eubacteriales bacterium]|nr:thioredoxin family protein [Eubacteriales bacterium]